VSVRAEVARGSGRAAWRSGQGLAEQQVAVPADALCSTAHRQFSGDGCTCIRSRILKSKVPGTVVGTVGPVVCVRLWKRGG
jgi:hypothetical protein